MTQATDAPAPTDAAKQADRAEQPHKAARRRAWLVVGVPVLVALVVRIAYLLQIQGSVLTTIVFGDARSYDSWAQQIAAGDWVGSEVFYQAPAYPYFLAVVYSFAGHELTAVRIAQIVMGSVACGLLAYATRAIFAAHDTTTSERKPADVAGMIAGLMLALYPPAIFFDGIIQKASLGLFLLCAMLACIARLIDRPQGVTAVAAGVLLGVLALTRENALIFAPVLFAWLAWQPRQLNLKAGRRFAVAGMFLAGLLIVLMPVAARNASVGGGFALTTSQFGPNFYIGNGAEADGTYRPLVWGGGDALVERHDARRLAEAASGRSLSWGEVSDYWRSRTLDEIGDQPGRWAGLMVTKVRLLLNHTEIADTEAQQVYEDRSWLLRALAGGWGFGSLLVLGALGAALTATQWRRLMPLYLLAGSYAVAVVAFYVMARYRFPLAPLLMPLAAGGMAVLYTSRNCLKHLAPQLGVGLVAAVVLGFVAFQSLPQTDARQMRAVTYSNAANVLAQDAASGEAELDQAVALYDAAITAQPGYAKAYNGRGIALAKLGDNAAAFASYKSAIDMKRDYADAMFNMAVLLERTNQPAAADQWYRSAIKADPQHVEAYVNLGRMLAGVGRFAEAFALYQKAIDLEPDNAAAWNNMGTALARAGDLPAAAKAFERALAIRPNYAEAQNNLDRARGMLQE